MEKIVTASKQEWKWMQCIKINGKLLPSALTLMAANPKLVDFIDSAQGCYFRRLRKWPSHKKANSLDFCKNLMGIVQKYQKHEQSVAGLWFPFSGRIRPVLRELFGFPALEKAIRKKSDRWDPKEDNEYLYKWHEVPGETAAFHYRRKLWVFSANLDDWIFTIRVLLPGDSLQGAIPTDEIWSTISISISNLPSNGTDWTWADLKAKSLARSSINPTTPFSQPRSQATLFSVYRFHDSYRPGRQAPFLGQVICPEQYDIHTQLVGGLINRLGTQWYSMLFETVLSHWLTRRFTTAYLLLAAWDVDIAEPQICIDTLWQENAWTRDNGPQYRVTEFPNWEILSNATVFWYKKVLIAVADDLGDAKQKTEAIASAEVAYNCSGLKKDSFAVVLSSKELMIVEFGHNSQSVSNVFCIFEDVHKEVNRLEIYPIVSVNMAAIAALIDVFKISRARGAASSIRAIRLLPLDLWMEVHDYLDRKEADNLAEAFPDLAEEFMGWNVNQSIQRLRIADCKWLAYPVGLAFLMTEKQHIPEALPPFRDPNHRRRRLKYEDWLKRQADGVRERYHDTQCCSFCIERGA